MKKVNSQGYGDHYVHIKIAVPKLLSKKQKALMQAYAEIEEETPGQIYGVAYDREGKKESKSNGGNNDANSKNYSKPKMADVNKEKFNDRESKEGFFNTVSMMLEEHGKFFALGFVTTLVLVYTSVYWDNFDKKPEKDDWNSGKEGAGILIFPNGPDKTRVHGSIFDNSNNNEKFKDA